MSHKFQSAEFYMSQFAMDVCIEVLDARPSSKGITALKINFWNLGYTGKPWRISKRPEEIKVHDRELDTWVHLDYDLLTQPRFLSGLPLGASDE